VKKKLSIPSNICPEAQTYLENLTALLNDQDVLTSLDDSALQLIGNTYHTYWVATQYLLDNPANYLIESPRGEIKAHPFVKIALDSQIQLDKLMDKFGLNPKARKEISKPKDKKEKKSPIDKFFENVKPHDEVRDQIKN
jgi:P27 family predicted phage terminase small subunit